MAKSHSRGQAAIMISASMVVTMGALGLVVDLGWAYWRQEAAKTAAVAAATAAIMSAKSATNFNCTSASVACTANASTYGVCSSIPVSPPVNNIDSGCLYAQRNGFVSSGRQTVQYLAYTNNSPVRGVSPTYWVRFKITEILPATFSAVLGQTASTVSAESTAGIFTSNNGACLYALNYTAPGAITLKGGTEVDASCGVWDNSNAGDSLKCSNNTTLNAAPAAITLAGGNACSGSVSPNPLTNQPPTADPFASVPTPADMHRCDYNGISAGQSITVPSDGIVEVCGDIDLTGNGTTHLPAALYYLTNGGGLNWHNGSINGTDVTLFLTGGSVTINGNMAVDLRAPTSGPYHGLVIYQERGLASPPGDKFNGGSSMNFSGSIYLPGSAVEYAGGSQTYPTALIADTITFTGTSNFGADSGGSVTGLGVPAVAVIE